MEKFNDVVIRPERAGDERKVEELVRNAFWNVYRPGCVEHFLLHKLRADERFVKELDFVMEKDGEIIGQNVFVRSEIRLNGGGRLPVLSMGPISITPELKRKGYGKFLLDYCLERAALLGFGAVCIEGNIDFYGKCGFRYAREYGLKYEGLPDGVDDRFFLCRVLKDGYLDGVKGVYGPPSAYMVDDADVDEFDKTFPPKKKLKLPGQLG